MKTMKNGKWNIFIRRRLENGAIALQSPVKAAKGRRVSAHFGAYKYT